MLPQYRIAQVQRVNEILDDKWHTVIGRQITAKIITTLSVSILDGAGELAKRLLVCLFLRFPRHNVQMLEQLLIVRRIPILLGPVVRHQLILMVDLGEPPLIPTRFRIFLQLALALRRLENGMRKGLIAHNQRHDGLIGLVVS